MAELIPAKAPLEEMLAGGVALYDLTDLLPKSKTVRLGVRPVDKIVRAYFHHSGRHGAKGWKGAFNSARYVVESRGFPAAGYHFWLPYAPIEDGDGNYVAFRLNKDRSRCWHTGGKANSHGVGVCFQGNLSKDKPSDFQEELFEALVPWMMERYDLSGQDCLSFHAEADKYGGKVKPTCPGPHVRKWVEDYRNDL